MGIIKSLSNIQSSVTNPRDPVLAEWWGNYNKSSAGINVTPDAAMRIIAVNTCVRIIAESIAMMPIHLFSQTTKDGKTYKERIDNTPLARVLGKRPNNWQTPFEFKEMMTAFVCYRGNSYAEIISAPANPVSQIIPLHPDKVRMVTTPDDKKAYLYKTDTEERIIFMDEMLHIRGLSSDGYTGLDPISHAAEALGISIAAEQFGASFFGNGTIIGGVLEHPMQLSDQAYERLKGEWNKRHQGASSAHKPAILEEGMKWQSIGIEPEKAQFLETRKFQVTEIARMFRVPPHMLADLDRATFSNIEHQSIEFVTHTLLPWVIRWEEAISRDLMTVNMQNKVYPKFNMTSLMRGDTKTRFESYQMAAGGNAPWMDRNEIRALEELNPKDGLDEMLSPLNMGGSHDSQGQREEPESETDEESDQENRINGLLNVAIQRLARKEQKILENIYKKTHENPTELWSKVSDFYKKHSDEVAESLQIDAETARNYTETCLNNIETTKFDRLNAIIDKWDDYTLPFLTKAAKGERNEKMV